MNFSLKQTVLVYIGESVYRHNSQKPWKYELPLVREYQKEFGDHPGEEICYSLLKEIKGEFLLTQDN